MALLINGDIQHFAMGVPAIQHASGDPLNSSPYVVKKYSITDQENIQQLMYISIIW